MQAVIVTLGARGALLATAEGLKHIAPTPVKPVDTTGAGDAFVGSFARYHAGGSSLEDALARAARYAADSVTAQRHAESLRDRGGVRGVRAHALSRHQRRRGGAALSPRPPPRLSLRRFS